MLYISIIPRDPCYGSRYLEYKYIIIIIIFNIFIICNIIYLTRNCNNNCGVIFIIILLGLLLLYIYYILYNYYLLFYINNFNILYLFIYYKINYINLIFPAAYYYPTYVGIYIGRGICIIFLYYYYNIFIYHFISNYDNKIII